MGAGDAELRGTLRVVVHVHQVHLDVIPVVVALSRNLLPPVEVGFGAVHEVERHPPVGLGAQHGSGDDLANALVEGVHHHVALGILDVGEHELPGGAGDTVNLAVADLILHLVANGGFRVHLVGFEQGNLVVGVFHHVHHLLVVEKLDLARLGVDTALHGEVGEFALGGLHHGIRDHLGHGFLVQPLFAGDFLDDFQQVVLQICLCLLKFWL